ncbi:hypothetical protein [Thalassoglobus sp.]|uniref:hypothetical protein n=1 Tax=Thalassoglobus sp. TaxID=2795869 RepID=UPI003AA964F6
MSSDNPFEVSGDSYGDRSGGDYDSSGVEVSGLSIQLLAETRPWVSLIGVLMWVGTVLMVLGSLFVIAAALFTGETGMILMGFLYVLIAVVYGIMAKSLTGYASKINSLIATERLVDLEEALRSQKTFWKTVGIITVIYLVCLILMIIGMMLFGVMLGNM